MFILIAAVGVDPGYAALRGDSGHAPFIAVLVALGGLLLGGACVMLWRCRETHARYTGSRR